MIFMLFVGCFMMIYTFFFSSYQLPGRSGLLYLFPWVVFCVKLCTLFELYLFDLSLQLLVQVPEVPHGQLVLCAHHDPLHMNLIWQVFVFFPQILTFLRQVYMCDVEQKQEFHSNDNKMMDYTQLAKSPSNDLFWIAFKWRMMTSLYVQCFETSSGGKLNRKKWIYTVWYSQTVWNMRIFPTLNLLKKKNKEKDGWMERVSPLLQFRDQPVNSYTSGLLALKPTKILLKSSMPAQE